MLSNPASAKVSNRPNRLVPPPVGVFNRAVKGLGALLQGTIIMSKGYWGLVFLFSFSSVFAIISLYQLFATIRVGYIVDPANRKKNLKPTIYYLILLLYLLVAAICTVLAIILFLYLWPRTK